MGIDRIGKGGGIPPTPETATGGVEKKGQVEKTFSVERPDATKGLDRSGAVDTTTTSPLARLRAGEIDVNAYMDLKVDEATSGLSGISSSKLADIKKILREQMATDPGLSDLVRQSTGHAPSEPEE